MATVSNQWHRYVPDNTFTWWQALFYALVSASLLAVGIHLFYQSRSQAVPDIAVVVLGSVMVLSFFLASGVDHRLDDRIRAMVAITGASLTVVAVLASALFTLLW